MITSVNIRFISTRACDLTTLLSNNQVQCQTFFFTLFSSRFYLIIISIFLIILELHLLYAQINIHLFSHHSFSALGEKTRCCSIVDRSLDPGTCLGSQRGHSIFKASALSSRRLCSGKQQLCLGWGQLL